MKVPSLLRVMTFVAAAMLMASSAATAQDPPVQGERISFPFKPPLDQMLRYRVTKTTTGSRAIPPIELEQELTYRRVEDGYLLEIATTRATRAGQTITPESPNLLMVGAEDMISLLGPITLRLDALGRVMAVHDWDKVRDTILSIPDRVAAQFPAEGRERMRDLIVRGLNPLLQTSAEGAFTFVGKEWPPMLTFNSAPFEIGKNLTTRNRYNLFDGEVPVSLVHDVLVERTSTGGLALTELQHADTAEFREAWRRFSATMPAEMAALREADLRRMTQLNRNTTTHLIVDSAGVLQSGYWEVRMEHEGVIEEATRVEFERLE